MVLIVSKQADQKVANEVAKQYQSVLFANTTHCRAIHGADKVVIIGIHPRLERLYQGICPVQVINPSPRPVKQIVRPKKTRRKAKVIEKVTTDE